ncbi:hypothetical protein D8674_010649 [Pyrus ussuriensis x Pyrus communis]|uniref:Uncharacterized protein n=1 Tax=Pyrus ussuriensis x Pyrus communis TaxID=2448454 RepID=A0A5N5FBA4_9ROSA|nr:hypothetical protein D8674_010649 [Pyrus ussuriensis x Pyrus communis]
MATMGGRGRRGNQEPRDLRVERDDEIKELRQEIELLGLSYIKWIGADWNLPPIYDEYVDDDLKENFFDGCSLLIYGEQDEDYKAMLTVVNHQCCLQLGVNAIPAPIFHEYCYDDKGMNSSMKERCVHHHKEQGGLKELRILIYVKQDCNSDLTKDYSSEKLERSVVKRRI